MNSLRKVRFSFEIAVQVDATNNFSKVEKEYWVLALGVKYYEIQDRSSFVLLHNAYHSASVPGKQSWN